MSAEDHRTVSLAEAKARLSELVLAAEIEMQPETGGDVTAKLRDDDRY